MKIKLLKNHVLGKKGDIVEPIYQMAKYLVAIGVAVEHKQTKIDGDENITEKTVDDGSRTKKRATRKSKANAKP